MGTGKVSGDIDCFHFNNGFCKAYNANNDSDCDEYEVIGWVTVKECIRCSPDKVNLEFID